VFTAGLARWWPLRTHSLGQEKARTCAVDPFVGGEVYEVQEDGTRGTWGRVVAWEPPHRLVLTWHPGRPADTAQELEVRFVATPEGTRVDLEHRSWQQYGPAERAAEARQGYEHGWETVFVEAYAAACRS
jgi:uncharacterized protein YndB with AHSA1/START domain